MKYRVFDSRTGKDVTDEHDWVMTPDGQLYIVGLFGGMIAEGYCYPVSC